MEKGNYVAILISLIHFFVRVLTRISGRLGRWISDLKYFAFMASFGNRDDDIWIVTFMKSGTTLTQMLLYQLTTDGNMNFKHINEVSPWLRNAAIRNLPPADIPIPRVLKSHDPYTSFDRSTKGRFIFVVRNGLDVAASYYHHKKNYGDVNITYDRVFRSMFVEKGRFNWFSFVKKWTTNKYGFPMLIIQYEDILENFDMVVDQVVQFCDLTVDDKILQRTRCKLP